ncbi:o-succinylbenzoate synthase [bacterium]|nr:o-succinylbenzoate synthase [bacterium]
MFTYEIKPYTLEFLKPAKTSRNVFETREIQLIHLYDTKSGRTGIGEAAPLKMLSIDDREDYKFVLEQKLSEFCEAEALEELDLDSLPSIKFGVETALHDLNFKETYKLFDTPFTKGMEQIPINGLVWMADLETMYNEALSKIEAGFNCIKFKVGAHDFDKECMLLEKIRKQFSAFKIELRLDANGAFKPDEAAEQLQTLKRFEIHSIEQPIKPKQWDAMAFLCREQFIPIALDEELIGLNIQAQAEKLLREINPQYLILKPNLIGGLANADSWIKLAAKQNIDWWATSALEGNIGLNAIAQWVSQYHPKLHQGLGTGSLYKDNIEVNLQINEGYMQRIVD